MRLKNSLQKALPGVEINSHSANGMTSKIEVAWIENGQKKIIWSKGKQDTEGSHEEIIKLLKSSQ